VSSLIDAIRAEIRAGLRARADAARAPAMQAYMKSAMPYYGVPMPAVSRLCREVFARRVLSTRAEWQRTVETLWRDATHREERYAAIALTGARPYDAWQRIGVLPLYRELIVSGAWWDLVDPIATSRLPVLLVRDRARMSARLRTWARGDDMWLRRAAILSQLKLKRDTDLALLYDAIEPSIDSREFFLRKAVGWALREHAKTDAAEVLRYVHANRTRLSGLSQREALKRSTMGATGQGRNGATQTEA
jgi:3-methyladenine DNA glycosylase AlkD